MTPEHLKGEAVLLLEDGHCLRRHAEAVCTLPEITRSDDMSATSLQTMVQMVGGGLGLSLIPKIAADAGITAGTGVTVRPFTSQVPGRTIVMAWRNGSSREEDARLIGSIARDSLKKATT